MLKIKHSIYILIFYSCLGYCDNIVVLGDSLSSAHGISRDKGWVQLLQNRLIENNYPYNIINASISGETTKGGVARLPNILKEKNPKYLIIALGSNDGLRGLAPMFTKQNLINMINTAKQNMTIPIVVRFRMPLNYGPTYIKQFDSIYDVIKADNIASVTNFLLDKFADNLTYFQADGLHPVENAQIIMLDNVWPEIKTTLDSK